MNPRITDRVAIGVFVVFAAIYLYLATYVCQDLSRNTFDEIQGVHIFDIDDSYRLFLARIAFSSPGMWLWNFILPVNIAFDGFFSWLTGHGVYWMRTAHIVAVLSSLYLVYRAGRHLGIAAGWMLASCSLLLLMPLYVFLSMSFYGESLLAAAMGVALFAHVTKREKTAAVFISLFPLIRPEGIFFLGGMVARRLLDRRILPVALIVLPGFIYFCAMLYVFPSASDYMGWRSSLDAQYKFTPEETSVMGFGLMPYYTINPLWWLLGAAGAGLAILRPLRPFFLGAAVFIVYLAVQCLAKEARGEPRYLFSLLPLFALSVAAAMDALCKYSTGRRKRLMQAGCALLAVFMAVENLAQIDPVRAAFFADRRWPLPGEGGANPHLYIEDPEITAWRQTTSRFLEAYTQYDRSIKKVIIHAWPVFYELDTSRLADGVTVEFAPMTPKTTFRYYGGHFYTMFPWLPQYTFYQFAPAPTAQPNDGKRYALYVGGLYNGVHPPIFANPVYQVYKVSYESRQDLPVPVSGAGIGR